MLVGHRLTSHRVVDSAACALSERQFLASSTQFHSGLCNPTMNNPRDIAGDVVIAFCYALWHSSAIASFHCAYLFLLALNLFFLIESRSARRPLHHP